MKKELKISFIKENLFLILYLTGYFFISILFLTKYPFVHSDESWLSGLSRTMMNEGLGATEYFFDLIPRYPHAIKIIFHMMQIAFIWVLGYNIFSVRLISLVFGIASLVFVYKILRCLTKSKKISALGMIIFSIDVQFIYASHLARQEAVILSIMLAALYLLISRIENWKIKNDIFIGIIIGLSAGVHPNSVFIALILGAAYLYYIIFEKKMAVKNLLVLMLTTGLTASVFVGISYIFDNNFINDYLKYGDDLGATTSIVLKFFSFPDYYRKLFNTFSVTYYLPDIRLQLILFALIVPIGLISLFIGQDGKKALLFMMALLFLNGGYLLLGRYSQPGIIFIFPLCYLLIFYLASCLKKAGFAVLVVLGVLILGSALCNILTQTNDNYDEYLSEIECSVPSDVPVLANLNAEYAFEYNMLHDYRNLRNLGEMPFEEYITSNNIKYIIYPEEMDYIYNNRPVWNVMYGNVYPYYEEMSDFLSEKCRLVHEFSSPYAMRIYMYAYDKEWAVKIYEVIDGN